MSVYPQNQKSWPIFNQACFAQLSACVHSKLHYLFLFFSHGVIVFPASCFLAQLMRKLSSGYNRGLMTSHVCVLQNVSLHLVCITHFLLTFSRPLASPTQGIFRCLLTEYLSATELKKPLFVSISWTKCCFFFFFFLLPLISQFACWDFGLVQELLWE